MGCFEVLRSELVISYAFTASKQKLQVTNNFSCLSHVAVFLTKFVLEFVKITIVSSLSKNPEKTSYAVNGMSAELLIVPKLL